MYLPPIAWLPSVPTSYILVSFKLEPVNETGAKKGKVRLPQCASDSSLVSIKMIHPLLCSCCPECDLQWQASEWDWWWTAGLGWQEKSDSPSSWLPCVPCTLYLVNLAYHLYLVLFQSKWTGASKWERWTEGDDLAFMHHGRFVSLMFSRTIGVPKGPLFALFALATWVLRKDAHAGTLDAAKVSQCSSRGHHPNQVVHFDFFPQQMALLKKHLKKHNWPNVNFSAVESFNSEMQGQQMSMMDLMDRS